LQYIDTEIGPIFARTGVEGQPVGFCRKLFTGFATVVLQLIGVFLTLCGDQVG
jgi:hypothetical protein